MIRRVLALLVRYLRRRRLATVQRIGWWGQEIEIPFGSFVAKGTVIGRRFKATSPIHLDPCEIGPYTNMGKVVVRSANHAIEYLNMQERVQREVIGGHSVLRPIERPVRIGAGCMIADNSTILEGVQIGNGAIVGAGAVVTRSVPDYGIATGNPAQVRRLRFPEEIVELIKPVDWWNWSDEKLRANRDLFEIDLTSVDPAVLRERLSRIV